MAILYYIGVYLVLTSSWLILFLLSANLIIPWMLMDGLVYGV